jgi:hypothetical protein
MAEISARMGLSLKVHVRVVGAPAAAADILRSLPQVADVQIAGDGFDVTLADGQSGDGLIARTLVRAGIDVVAIVPKQLKLDDAFLQLTKGIVH